VIDAQTLAILQEIVRRESRSLLQYIHDSYPWTPSEERTALDRIRALAQEQQECAAALARWLMRKRHFMPYLGSYAASFTTINYVALDYVIPKIVADERQGLAHLDADLAVITDPEARALVEALAAKKRAHLKILEELAAARPATTVSSRAS
jgi:rubrerythrin